MDTPIQEEIMEQQENNEQVETAVADQPETQKKSAETDYQTANFKAIREEKERIVRERDELRRRIQEMEKMSSSKKQEVLEDDDDFTMDPDDLVEGKHLGKVANKIKKLEKQMQASNQKATEIAIEATIKSQYPDFDKIVSKDNLDTLKLAHPEIAQTLNSSSDLYSKAVTAYTLIKKLGIHQDDIYKEDREKAQANAAKPRPLTSVSPQQGDSPLSKANAFANGLTDELKSQLYREMIEARKRY